MDTRLFRPLLYQLSYLGMGQNVPTPPPVCQRIGAWRGPREGLAFRIMPFYYGVSYSAVRFSTAGLRPAVVV